MTSLEREIRHELADALRRLERLTTDEQRRALVAKLGRWATRRASEG